MEDCISRRLWILIEITIRIFVFKIEFINCIEQIDNKVFVFTNNYSFKYDIIINENH